MSFMDARRNRRTPRNAKGLGEFPEAQRRPELSSPTWPPRYTASRPSAKLGPIAFGEKDELIFLGREISEQRNYSEEVARQIDREVRRLIFDAHKRAKQVLSENRDKLEALAQRLLESETVGADEFKKLMAMSAPSAV